MNRGWILVVGILVITVAGLMAMLPESEALKENQNIANLENEVVRIELAGYYFDVPMRYMYGQAIEKYSQWPMAEKERVLVDTITISLLLPDLRPYHPEDDARWRLQGHGDRVEISIMKPVGGDDWYEWLQRRIDDEVINGTTLKATDSYNLMHYSTPISEKYFPVDDANELSISCDNDPNLISPSCKVKSNLYAYKGVVIEYYYGLEYLSKWQEIDSAIQEILSQF